MSLVTLNQEMNNKLTIVNLPKVSLYFSYETLIALDYCLNNRRKLIMNSDYLNYSNITSKHLNKIKQLTDLIPIWKTEKQLDIILETILLF